MYRRIFKITLFYFLILGSQFFNSWGFFAHKKINEYAVYRLPKEMMSFYKKNLSIIIEKSTDPDKRCYVDPNESPRHYIDIDDYRLDRQIDSIPKTWTKAEVLFTKQKMLENGIVPWQINNSYLSLVTAMEQKNTQKIVRYAADLGHYVGDAHVPLHTTKNYNGQLTNQLGIHALWESRIPEKYFKTYAIRFGKAVYVEDPLKLAWQIIRESNALVDSVLFLDKEMKNKIPKHHHFVFLERNKQLIWTFSDLYVHSYHQALNGMVERRLLSAIRRLSDLWYSAWVDAGQPNLNELSVSNEIISAKDSIDINTRKYFGREEWN